MMLRRYHKRKEQPKQVVPISIEKDKKETKKSKKKASD